MKVINTTKARSSISALVDEVRDNNSMVGIGRRDKIEAVLIKYPQNLNSNLDDITQFNANYGNFDFLKEEKDLYTLDDCVEVYA